MTRILRVVDDALAAALLANQRAAAEVSSVKEAASAPRTEAARGLRDLASSLRSSESDLTYTDILGGGQ